MKQTHLSTPAAHGTYYLCQDWFKEEKKVVISKYHFKIIDDWHTHNTVLYSPIHTEYRIITWKLVSALCEEH